METLYSEAEMEKLKILDNINRGLLSQDEGAVQLGLSTRQVRRLLVRIAEGGSLGIKRRVICGSNRSHSATFKKKVLETIRHRYRDFGPTFASEKLLENEGYKVNKETLRQWMMADGMWRKKGRKSGSLHQSRQRRSCFGELVQIDGSHHDWFEGRRAKCCLLVFVDDATSRIVSMQFEESETTAGYFRAIASHLKQHGRPLAYYSDRHSIFKTTRTTDGYHQDTELHRALKDLRIELICAYSSQAKGRVERANQTLQDRLIKEMRLNGINDIATANVYLPVFIESYNKKFAVVAANPHDQHRDVPCDEKSLRRILSHHVTRTLSKALEFSFEAQTYQVQVFGNGYRYQNKKVTIYQHYTGEMEVLFGQDVLSTVALDRVTRGPILADRKDLDRVFDQDIFPQKPALLLPTGPTAPTQLSC